LLFGFGWIEHELKFVVLVLFFWIFSKSIIFSGVNSERICFSIEIFFIWYFKVFQRWSDIIKRCILRMIKLNWNFKEIVVGRCVDLWRFLFGGLLVGILIVPHGRALSFGGVLLAGLFGGFLLVVSQVSKIMLLRKLLSAVKIGTSGEIAMIGSDGFISFVKWV
jgi:hypothetical protein